MSDVSARRDAARATLQRFVDRRIAAGHAAEEGTIRAELVAKVFDAMCDVDYVDYGEPDTQGMAEAAVDAVVEFFSQPREQTSAHG